MIPRTLVSSSFAAAVAAALAGFGVSLQARVAPSPLFTDHAVLQNGREVPVWGTGTEGESVEVTIAGVRAETKVKDGRWKALLPSMKPGGPYALTIKGENTVVANDVYVGEVWVASGQSNMERQLGPRPPQKPIEGADEEIASANYPTLRQFLVAQTMASTEVADPIGKWVVCTPETAGDFSAVGFFFAKELQKRIHRPIGLIHTSWGGTPVESWMSHKALQARPDFKATMETIEVAKKDPASAKKRYLEAWEKWYQKFDDGSKGAGWQTGDFTDAKTVSETLPGYWETHDMPDFDGIVWYTRTFELPAGAAGADMELHLGAIDDNDTTWVNGVRVGSTEQWNAPRIYRVPASALKAGVNRISVRVADTGGNGGFSGGEGDLRIEPLEAPASAISLNGVWKRKVGGKASWDEPAPVNLIAGSPAIPGTLFNGMVAPIIPYAIKGVIWYQGEANVGRELQYRTLFPDMIRDWRTRWGQGEFPFLYVQIAPYKSMTPEIREAQLLALRKSPFTAMVVTTDVGDAEDIHPARKGPVGYRLACAAEAMAYSGAKEYSGPLFLNAAKVGKSWRIRFTHTGRGLVFKGGKPLGVEAFDAAGKPVEAVVTIDGMALVVTEKAGGQIAHVRYAWANVPEGNLYNSEGFPASPFRTDVP